MARSVVGIAVIVASTSIGVLPAVASPASSSTAAPTAVGFDMDSFHDGYQASGALGPKLARTWAAKLGGPTSYAVIAGGIVFTGAAKRVVALSERTGVTLWSKPAPGAYPEVAYDDGDLFVQAGGDLEALNAANGSVLWTQDGNGLDGPPTVGDGIVVVASDLTGPLAFNESTGKYLWTASDAGQNNGNTAVAIADNDVYVGASDSDNAYAALSGSLLWHDGYRVSAQGETTAYANGRVLTYALGLGLDPSTGAPIAASNSAFTPAVDTHREFQQSYPSSTGPDTLDAIDFDSGTRLWAVQQSGAFATSPVVSNGYVITATTDGTITERDESDGVTTWSGRTASIVQTLDMPNVPSGQDPATSLAVADGMLFVPTSNGLVAFSGKGANGCGVKGCRAPTIPTGSPTPPGLPADRATGYLIDPKHTDAQPTDPLGIPSRQLWTLDLGAKVSYPIIAGGKVFVTAGDWLWALDETTGSLSWGPVDTGGGSLVYDKGHLFLVNAGGYAMAFVANTGKRLWAAFVVSPQGYILTDFDEQPPNVVDGDLLASGSGGGTSILALSETNGLPVWSFEWNGNGPAAGSSPLVDHGDVFGVYEEGWAVGILASSRQQLWADAGDGNGGGYLASPQVDGSTIWAGGYTINPTTGALSGGTTTDYNAALARGDLYSLVDGVLQAHSASGALLWSFSPKGELTTDPVVSSDVVFVGSLSGELYGLNVTSGSVVWSTNVGQRLLTGWATQENIPQGLAVGEDTLVVPAGSTLSAYR